MRKVLFAEFFGTFALVFAGTGAVIINEITHGTVTHVGVALTFGLIIMTMIYTLGDISGAHFNPAVTVAFAISQKFSWYNVLPYISAQIMGALTGSLILRLIFSTGHSLGVTMPLGTDIQSFLLELILTLILMFVILNVSTGSKEKGITAGIVVGAVIGLEAMFAGPICGASMNPARSLAPALVSGNCASLWIYLTAPLLGATLAVYAFQFLRKEERI